MKCPKCDKELYDGAVRCPYCKTEILSDEEKKIRAESEKKEKSKGTNVHSWESLLRLLHDIFTFF